jgi:hypothetical protein
MIWVMEDGEIVERGYYNELVSKGMYFNEILNGMSKGIRE